MGTRHLISIYLDGETRLAQYGQWDGYPGGQGQAIVAFLDGLDLAVFTVHVRNSRMVTPEGLQALWEEAGALPGSQFVDQRVSGTFKAENPQLSRDSGASTLAYIMEEEEPLLSQDSTNFAADSLFCEWAYVIDLDKMIFEVYEGGQREPHESGRYADLPYTPPERQKGQPQEYWPARLVAFWPINEIPKDWIDVVEGGPMEALASTAGSTGRV